jgi:hypothetical protein
MIMKVWKIAPVLIVPVLLLTACGHHHAHPQASAAASSARAAAVQDVNSPKVLAAEKKLAPKLQVCLAAQGAHVLITGAGTASIKVVPQDIKLHFMGHAVRHPVQTVEATVQCTGKAAGHPLSKADIQAMEPKLLHIVTTNGMGHGSFALDFRQALNVLAVHIAGSTQ